jgi:hypothetical protein
LQAGAGGGEDLVGQCVAEGPREWRWKKRMSRARPRRPTVGVGVSSGQEPQWRVVA